MTPEVPHFKIPLNLPHAGKICNRLNIFLSRYVDQEDMANRNLILTCNALHELLMPYFMSGENPVPAEGRRTAEQAAELGRRLVEEIERNDLQNDRVGQCIRNLFECIERGQEGALLSLRAGENPRSLGRPV